MSKTERKSERETESRKQNKIGRTKGKARHGATGYDTGR